MGEPFLRRSTRPGLPSPPDAALGSPARTTLSGTQLYEAEQPGSGPFTETFSLPPFQRDHILDASGPEQRDVGFVGQPGEAEEEPTGAGSGPQMLRGWRVGLDVGSR